MSVIREIAEVSVEWSADILVKQLSALNIIKHKCQTSREKREECVIKVVRISCCGMVCMISLHLFNKRADHIIGMRTIAVAIT